MMFDAEYFTTHVYKQINELGSGFVTVVVRLNDKTEYRIQGFRGAHPGYMLAAIYPPEGPGEEHLLKRKRSRLPYPYEEIVYDQVAIPYERITEVYLTITGPEAKEQPIDTTGHTTVNNVTIGSVNGSAFQIGSESAAQETEFHHNVVSG
jgi:hypothetical protein